MPEQDLLGHCSPKAGRDGLKLRGTSERVKNRFGIT